MWMLLGMAVALVFRTGCIVPYSSMVSIGAAGQAVHAVYEAQPGGAMPDVIEVRTAVQDSLMRAHGVGLTAILICDFVIWSIAAIGVYLIMKKSDTKSP